MKKLMKLMIPALPALLLTLTMAQATEPFRFEVKSPDNSYRCCIGQDQNADGSRQISYSLSYSGEQIVRPSQMGLLIENRLFESALGVPNDSCRRFCDNLTLVAVDSLQRDTTWMPPYGEQRRIRDRYLQYTLHFRKGDATGEYTDNGWDKRRSYLIDVIVRAYDEGVAFCYHFPEASNGLFLHIVNEQTQFAMPEGTMAFFEQWAQGPFHLLPLSAWPSECERPLTMLLKSGTVVSLMEARMIDYARCKFILDASSPNTLLTKLYDSVDISTPYSTPWRMIRAAHRAVDLIAGNTLMLNLNDPNTIETSWIHPGKVFRCCNLTQRQALACIDFAADRSLQYVELDAGWYGKETSIASDATMVAPGKDLDIPALCQYGRSRGVGLWLYVNQRALSRQLDSIAPLYERWGVSGIKFGFVQVGNQHWTTWLHEAVRLCARHHLMVDIHDEYRPTGYSRTFPNLLSQEGVRGNEEMPDADHNVTLPFTRFLAGAADYTPCYFSPRIKTTHAHQLAMAIVYYSPIEFLYWYDSPADYHGEPELALWKQVPTTWDETFPVDGNIGQYVALARRSGDTWYLGVMNGKEKRKIALPTEFLKKGKPYLSTIYEDDPTMNTRTKVSIRTIKIKGGTLMKFTLLSSGGASVVFSKR